MYISVLYKSFTKYTYVYTYTNKFHNIQMNKCLKANYYHISQNIYKTMVKFHKHTIPSLHKAWFSDRTCWMAVICAFSNSLKPR